MHFSRDNLLLYKKSFIKLFRFNNFFFLTVLLIICFLLFLIKNILLFSDFLGVEQLLIIKFEFVLFIKILLLILRQIFSVSYIVSSLSPSIELFFDSLDSSIFT